MRSVLTIAKPRRRYPIRVSNWVVDPDDLDHMFKQLVRQKVACALFRRGQGGAIRFACFREYLNHDYEELVDESRNQVEIVEEFPVEVNVA